MMKPVFAPLRPAPTRPLHRGISLRHSSGERFFLRPNALIFLIGRFDPDGEREPDIDLHGLDGSRAVSRRHALIVRLDGLFLLREEAKVRNGTYVNGRRLAYGEVVALRPGDVLRIANIELLVMPG